MEFSTVAAIAFQGTLGVALASCAGLRAFLPLLGAGMAARMEWIRLGDDFAWLTSTPALVVFGVAVVVEVVGDKFPAVDHGLDAIGAFVKPAAGMVLTAAAFTDLSTLHASILGLILGGGAAGTVHLAKAKVRLLSSAGTLGIVNPILSVVEDVTSVIGTALSFVVPLLVLLAALAAVVTSFVVLRRLLRGGASGARAA